MLEVESYGAACSWGRQELYNGNRSIGNDLAQRDLEAWQES